MTRPRLTDTCEGIAETLGAAAGIKRAEANEGIPEGVHDCPYLEVYPEQGGGAKGSQTDRNTFGAGLRLQHMEIYADLYAGARDQIGENLAVVAQEIDAIIDVLEEQTAAPFFGVEGLKTFKWRWQRVIIERNNENYVGARFYLEFMV